MVTPSCHHVCNSTDHSSQDHQSDQAQSNPSSGVLLEITEPPYLFPVEAQHSPRSDEFTSSTSLDSPTPPPSPSCESLLMFCRIPVQHALHFTQFSFTIQNSSNKPKKQGFFFFIIK